MEMAVATAIITVGRLVQYQNQKLMELYWLEVYSLFILLEENAVEVHLVERLFRKQKVMGSTPIYGSISDR